MKQQVVDTNTGVRDPNLLFEINKLSMNKVQVFPDGELDVQARSGAPHSAAFARPTTTSRPLRAQPPRALGAALHGVPGMPFLYTTLSCVIACTFAVRALMHLSVSLDADSILHHALQKQTNIIQEGHWKSVHCSLTKH
jgi:hypothetical protein